MCGIAGIVSRTNVETSTINNIKSKLSHRGPDNQGSISFADCGVHLIHARLSVIDINDGANQPMIDAEKKIAIVFNGEIYNYKEIRKQIWNQYHFRTSSDTEVIIAVYTIWGEDGFKKLQGMYSFCLIDRQNKKLFLMRDRLGIKPLYISISEDKLVFASEVKAVIAAIGKTPRINKKALAEYAHFGSALGGRSFYEGIESLAPGCILSLSLKADRNRVFISQYLEPSVDSKKNLIETVPTYSEAVIETQRLFKLAIEKHLISDVPVGIFLSGGIDSSAIAAFASKKNRKNKYLFRSLRLYGK